MFELYLLIMTKKIEVFKRCFYLISFFKKYCQKVLTNYELLNLHEILLIKTNESFKLTSIYDVFKC